MIHYLDTVFCTARDCQKFTGCPRALTDQVVNDAEQWWGSKGAPVAVFENPQEGLSCYEPPEITECSTE